MRNVEYDTTPGIQVFVNKCILRVSFVISNAKLWSDKDQQPIEREIRRRKWGWIEHTLRKPLDDITRNAIEWNPREEGAWDDHRRLGNAKS